jgi:hypothetical protein
MPILTPAERVTYFPEVPPAVTIQALEGYIRMATALCESQHGANRPLELQQFTDLLQLPAYSWGRLPLWPVTAITELKLRVNLASDFRRSFRGQWQTIDSNQFTYDLEGRFEFDAYRATEAKVTYSAGFDFTQTSNDIQQIKAVCGAVVDWCARRYYGQLDAYLVNRVDGSDVGGIDTESWNYQRIDIWLQEILRPLKQYVPRAV